MSDDTAGAIQSRLDRWRTFVSERGEAGDPRLAQAEEQLRTGAADLMATGLDADEAFLVALKRVSEDDAASRAFARDYAETLLSSQEEGTSKPVSGRAATTEFLLMLGLAAAAGLAIKVPELFGIGFGGDGEEFYVMNISLFVLPFLTALFAWLHRPARRQLIAVSGVLVAGAVFANVYPLAIGGQTMILSAIHLPIVLWLAVGVVYAGGNWLSVPRRMEYSRFTGEWLITYVLIALGGGVLSAMTIGVFEAIGVSAETFVSEWVLPCGAMAAVIVAAWLVETRRNLVGGLAPMLARVFTPLFAIMLVALLVGVVWSRGFVDVEREVLILFDLLLVVVLAMLLYAISARDPYAAPGLFDRIQLVLVGCALAVDVFALTSIAVRLGQYGFSANKTAALGLNLILLVNLLWSAYLQTGFLRGKRTFAEIEAWQMRYLPVYAIWAAIVVIAFPPLFGFV